MKQLHEFGSGGGLAGIRSRLSKRPQPKPQAEPVGRTVFRPYKQGPMPAREAIIEALIEVIMEDESFIATQARRAKTRARLSATKKKWGEPVSSMSRSKFKKKRPTKIRSNIPARWTTFVTEGRRKNRYTGGERRIIGHSLGAGSAMGLSWRSMRVTAHNATQPDSRRVSGRHAAGFLGRGAVKGAIIGTAIGVAGAEHNRYKRLKAKRAAMAEGCGYKKVTKAFKARVRAKRKAASAPLKGKSPFSNPVALRRYLESGKKIGV